MTLLSPYLSKESFAQSLSASRISFIIISCESGMFSAKTLAQELTFRRKFVETRMEDSELALVRISIKFLSHSDISYISHSIFIRCVSSVL